MEIIPNESVLDYETCSYGNSRLAFRGPKQSLDDPYIAVLGGSEVFGRFIDRPLTTLMQDDLGVDCINLGCSNAGADAFLHDAGICEVASQALVTVIQITGAQNNSNRYYRVHPRRNDRFVAPNACLKALYPRIDFSNIHFTRHALQDLEDAAPLRFELVVEELKAAWVARMTDLLEHIKGRKVLFWMGANGIDAPDNGSSLDPLYIDRGMVEALRPLVDDIVEYVASSLARREGTRGMVYDPTQKRAAQHMFGPRAHGEAAKALTKVLAPMIDAEKPSRETQAA